MHSLTPGDQCGKGSKAVRPLVSVGLLFWPQQATRQWESVSHIELPKYSEHSTPELFCLPFALCACQNKKA